MVDLPNLSKEAAENATEKVKQESRNLLPWLPSPPSCSDCGQLMFAEREYVAEQARPDVAVWKCRECGYREYRDGE